MAKRKVTIFQAAKIFGVAKSTIMNWIKKGRIMDADKDQYGFYYWEIEEFQSWLARDYADRVAKFKEIVGVKEEAN
jgi:transposase